MIDSKVELQLPAKFVERLKVGLPTTRIDRAIERARASYWRRALNDYQNDGVVSERYRRAAEDYRKFIGSATWAYQRLDDGADIDKRSTRILVGTWRAIEFGFVGKSLTSQEFAQRLSTIYCAIDLVASEAPPIESVVRGLENFASSYHAINSK